MAKSTNPRKPTKEIYRTRSSSSRKGGQSEQRKTEHKPPSWAVMKSILTCKHLQVEQNPQQPQHPKQKHLKQNQDDENTNNNKMSKKMRCSGSLCNNTKVMQRPTAEQHSASPELLFYRRKVSASSSSSHSSSSMVGSAVADQRGSSRSFNSNGAVMLSSSSASSSSMLSVPNSQNAPAGGGSSGGSFKGMPFRKFSGCYECRMVVDPVLGFTRDPSLRSTICSCPECGEIFMKPEQLELHRAIRHAVSELGPEDTSRNIVEIIFQSSWLRKQAPVCKIDRILKVHNTNRTVSRFEEYRDSIKSKATRLPKKHPRCVADGNELLRFHCTTLMCSLGLNGSSNLCSSIPNCNVCSIIRDGFKSDGPHRETGILTTATSGRAHDRAETVGARHGNDEPKRAMLVCRVIAGRVKKVALEGGSDGGGSGGDGGSEEFDSVAVVGGVYSNLDELYAYNPKAILPCFVVIYRGF